MHSNKMDLLCARQMINHLEIYDVFKSCSIICDFPAFLGRAVSLISVGYVTHEMRPLAIALLGLSGFFAGMQQAGYVANFIDIAPR